MVMEYQKTDTTYEGYSGQIRVVVMQFNQPQLNTLICTLDLPKQAAEILAARFKEKQVLD